MGLTVITRPCGRAKLHPSENTSTRAEGKQKDQGIGKHPPGASEQDSPIPRSGFNSSHASPRYFLLSAPGKRCSRESGENHQQSLLASQRGGIITASFACPGSEYGSHRKRLRDPSQFRATRIRKDTCPSTHIERCLIGGPGKGGTLIQ